MGETHTMELRERINFNREWRFKLGEHPGAELPEFDDSRWEEIGLPHSFSQPYFLSSEFYVGDGWYRKQLQVPVAWIGKGVALEFDGAFQKADIYLNGIKVGAHQGGYTGFQVDITGAMKPGSNTVAVRVSNRWDPELAPRAGEHVFSGGIYRNVHLVVTSPLHVAWYGTFVTTPQVSADSAVVNMKTEVCNDGPSAKECVLCTDLLDPDGKTVASLSSAQSVPAGTTVTFDQTSPPITCPKLWHPDHPFLYRAVTTLWGDAQPADRYETTFGIRCFKWTADQGFFLNGEHHYFRGANVHQDHAGWGDAVTNAGFERDVKMVKDAGFDFVRGSHYPHAPAFSSACDRLGMLFWSENCFWGTGPFKSPWGSSAYPPEEEHRDAFEDSVKQSLREMIRIHRNHPSIVVWSMDNEVFFTDPSTLPQVQGFLKKLVAYCHELDPTRPAAIGGCQRGEIDKLGDVAGYNGDGATLFINPGIPNAVSEYGSTIAKRPGDYLPGWADLQSVQFPWRSGQVLWCAFDHGSLGGDFGRMGMIDYFRLPKRQWYWYRNQYREIPPPRWPSEGTPAALLLSADKTVLATADGTDDAQLVITVVDATGKPISNCPPVTLTVESGPGEFPTGPSITFAPDSDIEIHDGMAAMEFRSYHGGTSIIRASSPGLKDATVTITTLGEPVYVAGKTRPAPPRPYLRFCSPPTAVQEAQGELLFGRETPTRSSGDAPGHSSRYGNDGDPATFWQADNAKPHTWWQVDMERLVAVAQIKLRFPAQGNYRYRIEVSRDGAEWAFFADHCHTAAVEAVRTDKPVLPVAGRYVRVIFNGLPAGEPAVLADIEILGTQAG